MSSDADPAEPPNVAPDARSGTLLRWSPRKGTRGSNPLVSASKRPGQALFSRSLRRLSLVSDGLSNVPSVSPGGHVGDTCGSVQHVVAQKCLVSGSKLPHTFHLGRVVSPLRGMSRLVEDQRVIRAGRSGQPAAPANTRTRVPRSGGLRELEVQRGQSLVLNLVRHALDVLRGSLERIDVDQCEAPGR